MVPVSVLYICIYLNFYFYGNNAREASFKVTIQNCQVLDRSKIWEIKARSRTYCLAQCLGHSACNEVSFHKPSGSCLGFSGTISSCPVGSENKSGWKHYRAVKGDCDNSKKWFIFFTVVAYTFCDEENKLIYGSFYDNFNLSMKKAFSSYIFVS